ncbi:endonuclease/exonuclease/phosphatase family protein [Pseudonocardia sp. HH130630-07]|uniref:endonuclease/exonuclease/phosphatase family protein n=1 Tax=Pseudonocardia sp. HH130630-07 TaxID=1690815 RepID=UPI0008153E37|nr:endonuclease/exonuclease/phosphatase family protein [Pseudonocardia sp. HH130630-07]ANY06278.1 hypothetical protein AFB00_08175 [Pseudonocardia sp. HH130630-07]
MLVDTALRTAVRLLPRRFRVDRRSALVGVAAFRPHLAAGAAGLAGVLALAGFRWGALVLGAAAVVVAGPTLVRLAGSPTRGPGGRVPEQQDGQAPERPGESVPGRPDERAPSRPGDRVPARPGGTVVPAPGIPVRRRFSIRRSPDGRGTARSGPTVTVLVANVLLGRADPGALAQLVTTERPDLVVLPEAGTTYRDALLPLLPGYRGWSSVPPGIPDSGGTVVVASARAGDVRVRAGRGMRVPHLEVDGGLLGDRTLYAVHTSAPTAPRRLVGWRSDLALIGRWTGAEPAPLVAGDLNAVLDHRELRRALGGCRDSATGVRPAGTYPSSWPRWAGLRIDHVLVPRGSATRRYRVFDLPGSDHRGVLVEVTLPAQPVDGY